jgi:excisionase family DNA binding protein
VAGHAHELHNLLTPGLPGGWVGQAEADPGNLDGWHDPLAGLSVELRREARALASMAREVTGSEHPESELGDLLAACKTFLASLEAAGGQVSALLTKRQAAELLSVSPRQVDYLRESGRLQAVKVGHAVRFRRGDLQRFIDKAVSS